MPEIKNKKTAKTSKNSKVAKYPEYRSETFFGEEAMDAEAMKVILGWCTDIEEAEKAGCIHPTLTDLQGNKVWLLHNKGNRPFDFGHAMKLSQDMLQNNWKKNGECLSVGEYGNVLSGQHRGVALVLAQQRLESADEKKHWAGLWKSGKVRVELQINFGVAEDQDTKNTIDNVKARSFSDVLYGTGMFDKMIAKEGGHLKPSDEKTLCRLVEFSIRTLWDRTGAKKNPYSPYRTHSESMEFLNDHPTIKRCVHHVWSEYAKDWAIKNQRMPAGTMAGLMYLMAASDTNEDQLKKYGTNRVEKMLDLTQLEKAEDFVVILTTEGGNELHNFRLALGQLSDGETDNTNVSAEKVGMLCKAWNLFKDGEEVTKKAVKVHRTPNAFGVFVIDDTAIDVGGIDKGPYKADAEPEEDEAEEIAQRIAEEKAKKEEKAKTSKKGKGKKVEIDLDDDSTGDEYEVIEN